MGKYEEALERAKELHEAGNALTKLQMEIVFPVLKESEDERIICNIKKAAELYWSDEPLNEILSWLEKQKEQKPAEWSEEDEFFRQQLIVYCDNCVQDSLAAKCVAWLKSLRPQPHWKPSKEQMKSLAQAVCIFATFEHLKDDSKVLTSLYNNLQKLLGI